ncbi:MAG: class I SAM-dependent methyltransferase [Verrucomicrobia bacterium]|jgi:2-polyprenyl-3-methyl-5-hydroxy-6-metoxy-1,4-benzoquinol methylase|nr:class I SAM-dependent methyltransferase [Verrucomicrobiota bacterium]
MDIEETGSVKDEWVERCCPGCGQTASRPVWRKGQLHVVACCSCDVFYANPVEEELASGKFYDRLGVPFYLSPNKLEGDYSPVRFNREMAYFRRHCPEGAVLDVGCSTGAFLFRLNSRPEYQGVGMDVTGPALDHAESKGVPVIRESFLEHDFAERRFRAITFWAVVEHLTDPLRFLQKAVTLLEPGGLCFVLVPNRLSLATRILGSRYRYVMPDHVNYFSRRTLIDFIERVPEFEVIDDTTMKFNPIVILQDMRRKDDRVPDGERAELLKKTTAWKQSSWLIPLRWGYDALEWILGKLGLADNLVVVARKRK